MAIKATVFRKHGGPEVLEAVELSDPTPAPNEVIVGVKACALNHLGAHVITTASTDAKLSKAKALGADEGIHYKDLPLAKGVDVVFEHIGPETFANSIASLKKEGRLVFCGATSGAEVSFDLRPAYLKHLNIQGSFMGGRGELLHVLKLIESGCLRPVVDSVFPLEEARKAHLKMESRDVFGKIVLRMGN